MARILIVDDEVETLELLAHVVSLLGHTSSLAESCPQALAHIESNKPDLILLDLMMPEIDGYETMRRIRAKEDGHPVPIVVVTASQELDVEERVEDAGGDAVYYKPISIDMLAEAVSEHVAGTDSKPLQEVA